MSDPESVVDFSKHPSCDIAMINIHGHKGKEGEVRLRQ